jgi:hypothetical protein
MAIEEDIVAAVSSLFNGRFYYMTAPFKTPRPFGLYTFVGGRPISTFCGDSDRNNYRIQFNIWDQVDGTDGANSVVLMRQLAAIVTSPPLRGVSQGGLQSIYDDTTRTFGTRQDFSFWA